MATDLISLQGLNALDRAGFVALLGPVFEHADWVAEGVVDQRPFASLSALHAAMMSVVRARPQADVHRFLSGHPRLASASLKAKITAESAAEQTALGMDKLDDAMSARLDALNTAYEARFGFPFILAARFASLEALMASFERRSGALPEAEREEALREISAITFMRLLDKVAGAQTGGVTLEVTTPQGAGIAALKMELWHAAGAHLATLVTNSEGRTTGGAGMPAGDYEIRIDAAAHFARGGLATPERAFMGKPRLGFTLFNPEDALTLQITLSPMGCGLVRHG